MIRLFRHYVPTSLIVLGLIELVILAASTYVGTYFRFYPNFEEVTATGSWELRAAVITVIFFGFMVTMGLYQRHFPGGRWDILLRIGLSFLLGLFSMTLLYYLFPALYLGRGAFALSFFSALIGIVAVRLAFYHIINRDNLKARVLVLGAGERARQVEELMATGEHGCVVAGYLPMQGETVAVDPERVLTVPRKLWDLAEAEQVDELVVAVEDRRRGLPVDDLLDCKMQGLNVVDVLGFIERETGKICLHNLQPSSMIYSDGFRRAVFRGYSKRAFDVLVSLAMVLVTLPIMAVTALAIFVESGLRGPILYRQIRVGQDGREFEVLKFRSMRTDAEKDGRAIWAKTNDDRITRVGGFIRKTRIDELPQLLNVLRGDMSFVGPRPERPTFVADLEQTIPYYGLRHRVNPGITGWAQICYPYGSSIDDARNKLEYDLYYIKNYSLFLDLMVLFQTAHVILWGKGAR